MKGANVLIAIRKRRKSKQVKRRTASLRFKFTKKVRKTGGNMIGAAGGAIKKSWEENGQSSLEVRRTRGGKKKKRRLCENSAAKR